MNAPDVLRVAAERLEERAASRDGNAGHASTFAPEDRAVAALLRAVADGAEHHIEAWQRPSAGVDCPPARGWNNPEWLARNVEHHYGRALAVARVVVGDPT